MEYQCQCFLQQNELKELYNGADEYIVGTTASKLTVGHSVSEFT